MRISAFGKIGWIALLLPLASGCLFEEEDGVVQVTQVLEEAQVEYSVAPERKMARRSAKLIAAAAPLPDLPVERMVIETAGLDLEVGDHGEWLDFAHQLVQQYGGYIVNSNVREAYENVKRGNLTARVPQEKLGEAIDQLKNKAQKIEGEQRGGQDVTEEYIDLAMRLNNKRKTEERFQEILKKADKVEDILAVERELSRVRGEIERLEGRRQFLKNRVDLATITVNWHEPYPLGSGVQGKGFWEVVGQGFPKGIRGLARALQGVISLAIGLGPVLIGSGILVWLLVFLTRRWRGKS